MTDHSFSIFKRMESIKSLMIAFELGLGETIENDTLEAGVMP